jgi:hypothetical protein
MNTARRIARQQKCFQAGLIIREKLGGSTGPIEERLEHVRVAALGAVAEARAVMHVLKSKGLISEREEQDALDWGYDSLLAQLSAGQGAKIFEAGHG